jgi:putative transposase
MVEVAPRLSGQTGGAALDRALFGGPVPRSITVDHGTECMSRALEDWACGRGVQLDFIRPGKPVEHAVIEAFNGRLRDACLNVHQFTSIKYARATIDAWRIDDNLRRPPSSLGHLTLEEFQRRGQVQPTPKAVAGSSVELSR